MAGSGPITSTEWGGAARGQAPSLLWRLRRIEIFRADVQSRIESSPPARPSTPGRPSANDAELSSPALRKSLPHGYSCRRRPTRSNSLGPGVSISNRQAARTASWGQIRHRLNGLWGIKYLGGLPLVALFVHGRLSLCRQYRGGNQSRAAN